MAGSAVRGIKRATVREALAAKLDGKVVLVTNRTKEGYPHTASNLEAMQIRYDRLLCDEIGGQNKNERLRAIQEGRHTNSRKFNVVAWVGDNIEDFPGLKQESVGDPAQFGSGYFVLPNPMYGSWTDAPAR